MNDAILAHLLGCARQDRTAPLSENPYFGSMVDLLSRITVNYAICHGQPTIRGMRYTVQSILELLASGMTDAEILADYEDLEIEDLRACQAYAAMLLKKIGETLSMNGLTKQQIAAGQFRQPLTKQEFLATSARWISHLSECFANFIKQESPT